MVYCGHSGQTINVGEHPTIPRRTADTGIADRDALEMMEISLR